MGRARRQKEKQQRQHRSKRTRRCSMALETISTLWRTPRWSRWTFPEATVTCGESLHWSSWILSEGLREPMMEHRKCVKREKLQRRNVMDWQYVSPHSLCCLGVGLEESGMKLNMGKQGEEMLLQNCLCSYYPNIFLLAIKYWHFLWGKYGLPVMTIGKWSPCPYLYLKAFSTYFCPSGLPRRWVAMWLLTKANIP